MAHYLQNILTLLKRVLILTFLFQVCRFLFFLFNYSIFSTLTFTSFFKIVVIGTRFDISAIIALNSLFILLSILPISVLYTIRYQKILKIIFFSVNFLLLLSNCVDFEYFKFILKRSSIDLLTLASTGDDFTNLAPQFIRDFWLAVLVWITLCISLVFLYNITDGITSQMEQKTIKISQYKRSYTLYKWIIFLLISGLSIVAIRGGLQLRPITIITAGESVSPENIPLVINTPFSMMKSLGSSLLSERNYFDEQELKKVYSSYHSAKIDSIPFKRLNVVVIIMESFSKEYIGSLNANEGYTPFLDSLIKQSLVFDHAFANGRKSIEGIPAVTASLPQLMTSPYILSSYSANKINSLASILREKGYKTAFYHGGNNGTMGFDAFSRMAGFEHYVGRKEYGKEDGFDGNWGIFDENFFQFFSQSLSNTPEPFLGCIFSLSSHHPYTIPEKYTGKFKKGTLPIHESIQYADYALKKFFETASHSPWFDSTLFVITADHTSLAEAPYYVNNVGRYAVPIIFYQHNSTLKGMNHTVIEQTDIMPSVLDYLSYKDPFFAYGKSAFDTAAQHYAVSFLNDTYQIISDQYVLEFDGSKSISLFNYETDTKLQNNILDKEPKITQQLETQLKGEIQDFNYRMMHNRMCEVE